jgi:hypothetical protein
MLADSAPGKKALTAALSVPKANMRVVRRSAKGREPASALLSTADYRYADRHRDVSSPGWMRGLGGFA